jgi:hypothetical protein
LGNGKRQAIRISVHGQFRDMLHYGWLETRDALSELLRVEKVDIVRPKAKLTPTGWRLRWRRGVGIGKSSRV